MESSVKDFETESSDRKSIIYTHTMSVYSDSLEDIQKEAKVGVGRLDLWLGITELFCELGQYSDALKSIQEARNLSSLSPEVFFQEGLIHEAQQHFQEAKGFYERALSINTHHKESRIHLAILHHNQKQFMLAEQHLMNVVRNDPSCHEAW